MLLVNYSTVCRDIGGSDPERMAAPRVSDYVEEVFKNTCIKVTLVFAMHEDIFTAMVSGMQVHVVPAHPACFGIRT